MKSIVITVLDDVCVKNNKDPDAVHLIEAAKSYGKVEDLDAVLVSERVKYEEIIKNLKAQLDACAEHGVTDAELEILRLVRKKANDENAEYEARIAEKDKMLDAIKVENEKRIEQIKTILGA